VVDEASGSIIRQDVGGYVYSGSRAAAIGLWVCFFVYKYMFLLHGDDIFTRDMSYLFLYQNSKL
jgi:hypothetical protein